jgi:hypothetical protein
MLIAATGSELHDSLGLQLLPDGVLRNLPAEVLKQQLHAAVFRE